MEGLIELYRVDIAYSGFIEMRLSAFSSFFSWFSSKEKFSKEFSDKTDQAICTVWKIIVVGLNALKKW